MRSFLRIIGLIALFGVLATSCVDMNSIEDNYDDTFWMGEYINVYEVPCVIFVRFREGATRCLLNDHTKYGYDLSGSSLFIVHWSNKQSFTLSTIQGEQTLVHYSGKIVGDIMTLKAYNCDGVAGTLYLEKQQIRELDETSNIQVVQKR